MSANEVGITQLVVPDTQLQPNLVGSNFTLLSTVLSFHRQNQFASRPRAFNSHWIPVANRLVRYRAAITLRPARAVVQHSSGSSPMNAGQLPSLFCKFSMVSKARSR